MISFYHKPIPTSKTLACLLRYVESLLIDPEMDEFTHQQIDDREDRDTQEHAQDAEESPADDDRKHDPKTR